MKKVKHFGMVAVVLAVLAACGGDSSPENKGAEGQGEAGDGASATDYTQDPAYEKGLEIVAKSDCGSCHQISEKSTGPAFKEIALRYANADEATIDSLAGKVINGGAGNWGAVPMMAHPQLSKEEARAAVKYVLLLKNG